LVSGITSPVLSYSLAKKGGDVNYLKENQFPKNGNYAAGDQLRK
jgi:hypothetical protein